MIVSRLRVVWTIFCMQLKIVAVDSFVIFAVVIQPLIVAVLVKLVTPAGSGSLTCTVSQACPVCGEGSVSRSKTTWFAETGAQLPSDTVQLTYVVCSGSVSVSRTPDAAALPLLVYVSV